MTAATPAPTPETPAGAQDHWLAQVLVEEGVLAPLQAKDLSERGSGIWVGAVARGLASDQAIGEAIARRYGCQLAEFHLLDPRATSFVPENLARRHLVVPLNADDRKIRIATSDPRDLEVEKTLEFITGRTIEFRVASPAELSARIDDLYRPENSINKLLSGLTPASIEEIEDADHPPQAEASLDAPITRLVDAMIADAVREGASDIHGEPVEGIMSVRYRIDGVLREVMRLPGSAGPSLVRRVKILARLDVTDPLHPHDGRATVRVDGRNVDLRISTVPMARKGEKVVLRILGRDNLKSTVRDLDLPGEEETLIQRLLRFREGMLLLTGPTGSGKTTTLYAMIQQLRTGAVNIVTIEDPVEYELGGISQLQVNEAQHFTFATALRSVLRQDPDIVLVGEIRDSETATIAIQAGQTGHFVLSTLHTNDAASTIPRLRDLGADSYNIASVLRGVMAQRLLRRLCDQCAVAVTPGDLPPAARPPAGREVSPRRSAGCKACGGTGYRGRLAILEIMPVDERVAHLIQEGALPDVLIEAARPLGMRTLWESGLDRVWRGLTSADELVRVVGEPEPEDGSETGIAPPPTRRTSHPSPPSPTSPPTRTAARASGVPDIAIPGSGTTDGPARILVADDDPQMRRLVGMILRRDGFVVGEAGDGLEALEAIESAPYDLLILDMDMPRLDGLGVLEELRARVMTASVPVLVLTARADETEIKALDLGAQDYLIKPVQPSSLSARVKAVLRRVRL